MRSNSIYWIAIDFYCDNILTTVYDDVYNVLGWVEPRSRHEFRSCPWFSTNCYRTRYWHLPRNTFCRAAHRQQTVSVMDRTYLLFFALCSLSQYPERLLRSFEYIWFLQVTQTIESFKLSSFPTVYISVRWCVWANADVIIASKKSSISNID